MDDFFKTEDLFNLEQAKKKQKKNNNKINIKQKYPQETFNKLIDNFNVNHKKTDNLSKEMIKNLEENKPLFFINKNIEQNKEDIVDIQLEKQRNSEKVPKIGSTGQINK